MPLVSNVHVDQPLSNISQAVKNSELVADKVWPGVRVKKDSDKYFVYDKSNLRPDDTDWGPKTTAKEVSWDVLQDSYSTERHGLQELVEDDEIQAADSPIQPLIDTTEILTEKMLIRREKRLVTFLSDLANYDADAQPVLAGATQWSDYASATSDPNGDISTARGIVFKKTFKKANLIVLPRLVYEKVREHPKIVDRIKYSQVGVVTTDLLAQLWDIENVVVAGSGENTAVEGAADVLAFIWPKHVFIGYVNPRPAKKNPSWGYRFESQPHMVDRWRDDPRKGEIVRVSSKDTFELVTKAAGYTVRAAIA
jgi:hypothetical protein